MYYFEFSKQQRQILKDIISYRDINIALYDNYVGFQNCADIEKCFNLLMDLFLNEGLLENDEPNGYGLELEKINTILNHQIVLRNSETEYSNNNQEKYKKAKQLFFQGKINDEYKKLKIPCWLEESWMITIKNLEIDKKINSTSQ